MVAVEYLNIKKNETKSALDDIAIILIYSARGY